MAQPTTLYLSGTGVSQAPLSSEDNMAPQDLGRLTAAHRSALGLLSHAGRPAERRRFYRLKHSLSRSNLLRPRRRKSKNKIRSGAQFSFFRRKGPDVRKRSRIRPTTLMALRTVSVGRGSITTALVVRRWVRFLSRPRRSGPSRPKLRVFGRCFMVVGRTRTTLTLPTGTVRWDLLAPADSPQLTSWLGPLSTGSGLHLLEASSSLRVQVSMTPSKSKKRAPRAYARVRIGVEHPGRAADLVLLSQPKIQTSAKGVTTAAYLWGPTFAEKIRGSRLLRYLVSPTNKY